MTTDPPKHTEQQAEQIVALLKQWSDAQEEAHQTEEHIHSIRCECDLLDIRAELRRQYRLILTSLLESALLGDSLDGNVLHRIETLYEIDRLIHELDSAIENHLYLLGVKEGERCKPAETQQQEQTPVPAPKQPEEVQKAPSWTAERWQVSSWAAYTYHPAPNGEIAAPVEAEQQETAAPAQPQETTVFTAPEHPTSKQLPPEVQEAATKYEKIKGQWRQAGARYRERHPDKIQEIQAQRKEKKREYDRQRYARRKAAREQAEESSSSEQP